MAPSKGVYYLLLLLIVSLVLSNEFPPSLFTNIRSVGSVADMVLTFSIKCLSFFYLLACKDC